MQPFQWVGMLFLRPAVELAFWIRRRRGLPTPTIDWHDL